MIKRLDDIKDDELRVIGQSEQVPFWRKTGFWVWVVIIVGCIVIPFGISFLKSKDAAKEVVSDVFDASTTIEETAKTVEHVEPLGCYDDTLTSYTEHIQKTINDIVLDIYIPHNAEPRLAIGTPDINDKSIIFAAQAADIRADNGKINGAFVLAGEPVAWGLSKKGYVAIIDGKVTIGVAEDSPLFEEVTEKGGYFFRQYPLVDNGVLVENEPKGKAIRKAICDRGGEIMVVISASKESFHDFAQALVDMQVNNAVYIVGSEYSYGFFRDHDGNNSQFSQKTRGGQKYENFIEWIIM